MAIWKKTYKGKKYDEYHDCVNSIWDCTCSVCGWRTGQQGTRFQYCPICGTHMENAICGDVVAREELDKAIEQITDESDMAYADDYRYGLLRAVKIIYANISKDEKDDETHKKVE